MIWKPSDEGSISRLIKRHEEAAELLRGALDDDSCQSAKYAIQDSMEVTLDVASLTLKFIRRIFK